MSPVIPGMGDPTAPLRLGNPKSAPTPRAVRRGRARSCTPSGDRVGGWCGAPGCVPEDVPLVSASVPPPTQQLYRGEKGVQDGAVFHPRIAAVWGQLTDFAHFDAEMAKDVGVGVGEASEPLPGSSRGGWWPLGTSRAWGRVKGRGDTVGLGLRRAVSPLAGKRGENKNKN